MICIAVSPVLPADGGGVPAGRVQPCEPPPAPGAFLGAMPARARSETAR